MKAKLTNISIFCLFVFAFNLIHAVPLPPPPDIDGTAASCVGDCETYTATNGQGGPYTWQISGGLPAFATGETVTICWNNASNANINLTDASATAGNETSNLAVALSQPPQTSIITPPYPLCTMPEQHCVLDSVEATGGAVDDYLTLWSSGGIPINVLTITSQTLAANDLVMIDNESFVIGNGVIPSGWVTFFVETFINITSQPCFGEITTLDDFPPTFVYTPPSNFAGTDAFTYTATYTLLDANGNLLSTELGSGTVTIEVLDGGTGQTEGQSESSCITACPNSTATYEVADANGNTYNWNVEGANNVTENGSEISIEWGTADGFLSITTTNADGCFDTDESCVEMLEAPTASFTTSPSTNNNSLTICNNQTVFFTNETENGSEYLWDFGDGTFSADISPTHQYTTAGTYTAVLTATSGCLCSASTSITIEVEPAESPTIECTGTECAGSTATYTTNSDCGTFDWLLTGHSSIIEGGGTNDDFVTVEWGSGTLGTISLEVASCTQTFCSEPVVVEIPLIAETAVVSGPTVACNGEIATFSAPHFDATSYTWSFDDAIATIVSGQGTNQINVSFNSWSTNISTDIEVNYENCYLECSGSGLLSVDLRTRFTIAEIPDVCENETSYLFATQIPNGWPEINCDWNITTPDGTVLTNVTTNTGNFQYAWNAGAGVYHVEAIATDANEVCNPIANLAVRVLAKPEMPTAIDGPTTICPNGMYQYTASASEISGSFSWIITSGNTITQQTGNTIIVDWGLTPPFELAVFQTGNEAPGCHSDTLNIELQSIGAFTVSGDNQLCQEGVGSYETDIVLESENYDWQIVPANAGSIISGNNTESIEIQWNEAGNHVVELNLCGQTAIFNVNVWPLPTPEVTAPDGLCPNATAILSTTIAYDSYTWENENGVISTDPTVEISEGGHYQLSVADNNGCEGTVTFFVDDYEFPEAFVSTNNWIDYCSGNTNIVLYTPESDPAYSYQWLLDGNPVGTNSASLNFTNYGEYSVMVTTENGCMLASNKLVLDEDLTACGGGTCSGGNCNLPSAGGTCVPQFLLDFNTSATFCNEVSFSSNGMNSFSWEFGDPLGGASSLENPTHTYSEVGTYFVTLYSQVPDISGIGTCLIGVKKEIDVPILADFTALEACAGEEVTFSDISTFIPTTNIDSWQWDFDDSNTSNQANPTHIYANAGNYDVTLTVSHSSGCISEITKTIQIFADPEADFSTVASVCENTSVSFSANDLSDIVEWEWNFGDPASGTANTSTNANTYHVFETPNTYTVTLSFTNIYGCINSFSQNIDIVPNDLALGNITLSTPSPLCAGETTILTAPSGGETYLWSSGHTSEEITVGETGIYSVTITNIEGCEFLPNAVSVIINDLPEAAIQADFYDDFSDFTPETSYNSVDICENESISLVTKYQANYEYEWSSGDTWYNINLNGQNLGVGTHTYQVTVTNSTTGCSAVSAPFEIVVHESPNAFIDAFPFGTICEGTPVTLTAYSWQSDVQFYWNNGQEGTTITVYEAGNYQATAVSEFGCVGYSATYTVYEKPDISLVPSGCYTRCEPDTICLPAMPNISTYQWFFEGSAVAAPEGNVANFVASESGEYQVELTNNNGCSDISNPLNLTIMPKPVLAVENVQDVSCNGLGLIEISTSSGTPAFNYEWSHDAALNAETADNLNADDYSVTVTDDFGCSDEIAATVTSSSSLSATANIVDITCDTAGAIAIDAAGNGLVYDWSHDAFLPDALATDLAAGIYSVTITDENGCEAVLENLEVLDNGGLFTATSSILNISCSSTEGSITITSDGVNSTYEWSHDATLSSNVANGLAAGIYSVTVTDENGCEVILDNLEVVDDGGNLSATADVIDASCGQDNGSITINAAGNNLTYVWSHDPTLTTNVAFNLLGNTSYEVTITDGTTCSTVINEFVGTTEGISTNVVSIVHGICGQNDGEVVVEATGGAGNFSYEWSHDATLNETTASNLGEGLYSVTVSDESGCTALAQAILTAELPIFTGNCLETTNSSITFSWNELGGVTAYEVVYGTETTSSTDNFYLVEDLAADEEVTITVTPIFDTVNCLVEPLELTCTAIDCPDLTLEIIELNAVYCEEEETAIVLVGEPAGGVFTIDNVEVTELVPNTLSLGEHTVTYTFTDENSCVYQTDTIVTIIPLSTPEFSVSNAEICTGEDVEIALVGTLSETATILWNFGEAGTQESGEAHTISYENSGLQSISVTIEENGCTATITQDVQVNGVSVTLDEQPIITLGESLTLNANITQTDNSDLIYEWSPAEGLSCTDCPNPIATPSDNIVYSLNVQNALSCEASANVAISLNLSKYLVPNAFSPNDDGVNDMFKVFARNAAKVEYEIFDRWGEPMFAVNSTDLNDGWNGTFKGKDCEVGVYVFYGHVEYTDGTTEKFKGNVSLIR